MDDSLELDSKTLLEPSLSGWSVIVSRALSIRLIPTVGKSNVFSCCGVNVVYVLHCDDVCLM